MQEPDINKYALPLDSKEFETLLLESGLNECCNNQD